MISEANKGWGVNNILRYAGIMMPILMIVYGFLVKFSIVPNNNYSSDLALYIISALWLVVLLIQAQKKKIIPPLEKVVIYHILTLAYFVFISGFNIPFIAVWVLLLIDTSSYFNARLTWASLTLFIIASLLESISSSPADWHLQITQMTSVISVSILGMAIVAILNSQKSNQEGIIKSRNRERNQREKLLTIINNLTDSMMVVNAAGKIEVYNAAALNLLDTNETLTGKNISESLRLKDDTGEEFDISKTLRQTKRNLTRSDLVYEMPTETIRVELTILPIHGTYSDESLAREKSFVITLRDITKEKTLDDERDEFISVVSHELRTPVAIAEGAISNLKLMIEKNMPLDKMKKAVDSTYEEVMFLANMVNDLSTLSRTERGIGDSCEIIKTKELGESLYNKYVKDAEEKDLEFNLDLGPNLKDVLTSRLYLEELLQNLITNSIKYTKDGSVTISIKNKANEIEFAVADTGIGISKNDQKRVFDKFYRSEDYRTRETGGTGLGLYVSNKLADKMDTKVELKSRLNHGSTFKFSLPIYKKD
ncbi:PAS domain-containing protein [Candidatus Saccharibacteria bacterium]|jgi:PAS domain S-box-containing protein|nr:PAS domain-containing protein [Candidatus Saccharibacteria bacterium]